MSQSARRDFLKTSAVAGTAAIALPAIARSAQSANGRVRVALVGMGGRMRSHVSSLAALANENVEIAAIGDCDKSKLDGLEKRYPELAGKKFVLYDDQRKVFDDPSIDAVSFSTQDHWHALQTIWACQAGKDVYVEKPPTWCISEGRKMVQAARKYKRMVQIGTQNRSSPNVQEGMQKLKEGLIGDLYMARGMTYKMRGNLGKHNPQPIPEGLNWDAWVGPAKMVEYSNFMHRRWYYLSNFASGDIANQTVHDIDKIRWGLGLNTHPTTVMSMGGRYVSGRGRRCRHEQHPGIPLPVEGPQRAGELRGAPLVLQQRSRDARPVSVRRSQSVRGRDLLRQQGLHDLPRLHQLLHVPRAEERARPLQDGQGRLLVDQREHPALPQLDRSHP